METVFVERGQASVELLAVIPLVAAVAMLGWQLVVAGHTFWKAREASRVAARSVYVAGERADDEAGRRRAGEVTAALLASSPKSSRKVLIAENGEVTVSVRVPLVAPFRAALGDRGPRVSARSRFAP